MYKKFTHSFVEERKAKPVEIVTERKDETGKSTYNLNGRLVRLSIFAGVWRKPYADSR